jgi:hypothetical protein
MQDATKQHLIIGSQSLWSATLFDDNFDTTGGDPSQYGTIDIKLEETPLENIVFTDKPQSTLVDYLHTGQWSDALVNFRNNPNRAAFITAINELDNGNNDVDTAVVLLPHNVQEQLSTWTVSDLRYVYGALSRVSHTRDK